ncbi:MAG: hypothetical protein M0002_14005 [Rhodospirillales bacterium]|nr:hypothetical protein [Rhodospirillales bacterium]
MFREQARIAADLGAACEALARLAAVLAPRSGEGPAWHVEAEWLRQVFRAAIAEANPGRRFEPSNDGPAVRVIRAALLLALNEQRALGTIAQHLKRRRRAGTGQPNRPCPGRAIETLPSRLATAPGSPVESTGACNHGAPDGMKAAPMMDLSHEFDQAIGMAMARGLRPGPRRTEIERRFVTARLAGDEPACRRTFREWQIRIAPRLRLRSAKSYRRSAVPFASPNATGVRLCFRPAR